MLNNLTFGSVCSGIEAASVAWNPIGLQATWFAEIDPFASAVLAHRFPSVKNLGDMCKIPDMIRNGEVQAPDILCGGTPCQAFSHAGSKKSLNDPRGKLSMVFIDIANAIDEVRIKQGKPPCIVFWENVPGILSTKDDAYSQFVNALINSGKRTRLLRSWIINSKDYGLPQDRRRLYVVATARDSSGSWLCTLSESLQRSVKEDRDHTKGNPKGVHRSVTLYDISHRQDIVRIYKDICPTLTARSGTGGNNVPLVIQNNLLRKLTPLEYERLMGFPDNWTRIPWKNKPEEQCPNMVRYKALGNSWAVPVVRSIMNNIINIIKE